MTPLGSPLLYLDFDGVLHPDEVWRHPKRGIVRLGADLRAAGHQLFEHADLLADTLEPYPDVRIVLSTSWVRILGYARARKYLPPALQARVIGATWHSHMAALAGATWWLDLPRGRQVLADVRRRQPLYWLAIDDDDVDWPEHVRDRLLRTDPTAGLQTPGVIAALRGWLSEPKSQARSAP